MLNHHLFLLVSLKRITTTCFVCQGTLTHIKVVYIAPLFGYLGVANSFFIGHVHLRLTLLPISEEIPWT